MAKSRYNIKGTKDFLVMAVFCGFMCVWAIRDAWFPTKKVLERHPLGIPLSFKVDGVLKEIHVKLGDEIGGNKVLATLHDDSYRDKVTEAEAVFEEAKASKDPAVEEKLDVLMDVRADLTACSIKNSDFTYKTSHGVDALQGTVAEILVEPSTHLDAGTPVMMIKPDDTFYLFNKTLSILMFIGTVVSLIFHRIASK